MNKTPILAMSMLLAAIAASPAAPAPAQPFGKMPDGRAVSLYTLTNKNGVKAKVTDLGANLVSLTLPDRNGKFEDVLHGFDSAAGYLSAKNPYFGATVGRFGNRIAHGKFTLDGKQYTLAKNDKPGGIPCHLHGGKIGFNKRLWSVVKSSPSSITFQYVSPDGEEGYPGTLTTRVTYTLTKNNELKWDATAKTDKPTIINMVHHPYWNLSGDPTKSINDHILVLDADRYLPTDAGLIPTGEKAPVAGTPMDFTKPTRIGAGVNKNFKALKLAGGYDHAWVLTKANSKGLARAARLEDPKSGRVMEVYSNQPAVQFYGGNFLDGTVKGKGGAAYNHRTALCLETERFPDAPNQTSFPSAVLKPGQTYNHKMVYKFTAK